MATDFQHQFTSLAPYYDELMAHVPYSLWVDYVLKICRRHQHAPHDVLDCACGTGNVSYELAKRGFNVTGVDFSEEMLEVARQKKISRTGFLSKSTFKKAARPEFIHSDLCRMELGRQFDTITCLYDSLNYLTAPPLLQKAFTQISRHLKPEGLFIFDMNAPYAFETDMFTQSDHRQRQKLQYDWIARYDPQTRLCRVEMIYTRQQEDGNVAQFNEVHFERSYAMQEITDSLDGAGLQLLEAFDSYRLVPPHAQSERWYFVAAHKGYKKDDQIL